MRVRINKIALLSMTVVVLLTTLDGSYGADNASNIISLAGDQDSFGTGKPLGSPVRLIDFSQDPADGDLDMSPNSWCSKRFFAWRHEYTLPANARLIGATLKVVSFDVEDAGAGDGNGGGLFDTKLFIDGIEVPEAFDDTYTPDIDAYDYIVPNTAIFSLSPTFYPLLQDGSADVMVDAHGGEIFDCIAIDFAELQLESVTTISIDIKPSSFPNFINLGSGGTVPVAIFSTTTFDATTVDPAAVTLANATVGLKGKDALMASKEDVNGDGLLDLVVHVSTDALQLSHSDTEAVLEGQTFNGEHIRGTDSVRIVPQ